MWRFTIDTGCAGRRLDRLLGRLRSDLPHARIQRLFRQRQVLVDGRAVAPGYRVRVGEQVAILPAAGLVAVPPSPHVPFGVLHDDEHLIGIDKPAGVAVHPGTGQKTRTLVNGLLHRYGDTLQALGEARDFGLTHRLDRETSGVLLVARTPAAHQDLVDQFRKRRVRKEYRALVAGVPIRAAGTIRRPLVRATRSGRLVVRLARVGEGRPAVTDYEVIERLPQSAFLAVRPHTGRTHQIRVHLAAIGHPVLGDTLYGMRAANDDAARRLGLHRLFLHALRITVAHPCTGRPLCVEACLPADLEHVLEVLRTRTVDRDP